MTVEQAVSQGIINNETLAYFMARTYAFLVSCGIKADGIRFRQHRDDEMAHYSKDCWDAEVETSYGWIEIAGHADRSAFDLTRHSERTKIDLQAARPLKEPKTIVFLKVTLNKKDLGKLLKQDSQAVIENIDSWTEEQKVKYQSELAEKGEIVLIIKGDKEVKVTKDLLTIETQEKVI